MRCGFWPELECSRHDRQCDIRESRNLNFFCTKADGQLVRKLFKESARDLLVSGDFVLQVQKRNGIYFGVVSSFTHKGAPATRR